MYYEERPELPIPIPTGPATTCQTWDTEAAIRLLLNNLHNAVKPEELIIYGGAGRCARNWEEFQRILQVLRELSPNQTLCIQSGRPVYIAPSFPEAPRIVIANSNLVPRWATQAHFDALDELGLMMYGQMTAGSWIYIGTQGILQGTFETLAALARTEFQQADLAGKFVLTSGMGGMSGAQPLAGTMIHAAILIVEPRRERIEFRVSQGYCDCCVEDLDSALHLIEDARRQRIGYSVGLVGNAAEVYPELVRRGVIPDVVTDQTPSHDPYAYVPIGWTRCYHDLPEAERLTKGDYLSRVRLSVQRHAGAMLDFQRAGAVVFDYGNSLRNLAEDSGVPMHGEDGSFFYPGFVPAYIRPQFCEGKGPFRWVALSGDPEDIAKLDRRLLELFPQNDQLSRWITLARARVPVEGLPSRICWLGYGDRARFGEEVNRMVGSRELSGPVAFGRDHLDCGSVASPTRETEAMRDGSDAVADWPLINFALAAMGGASWVSFHSGGGVGHGLAMHTGNVIVADGTPERHPRIIRVLTNDPGIGIARHADAGYPEALAAADRHGIVIPSQKWPGPFNT